MMHHLVVLVQDWLLWFVTHVPVASLFKFLAIGAVIGAWWAMRDAPEGVDDAR